MSELDLPHSREWYENWKPPGIVDGKLTAWNWLVLHPSGLSLGKYTDIGAFTVIMAKYGVEIGDNVEIGSHVAIYSESTIDGKRGKVTIGSNAKIGSHSIIMPGVSIGENATVGAFSFVNRDIPANKSALGIPIKIQGEHEWPPLW